MDLNKSPIDSSEVLAVPSTYSHELISKRDLNEFSEKSLSNLELDTSVKTKKTNKNSYHTWFHKNVLISPILKHPSTEISSASVGKSNFQTINRNV